MAKANFQEINLSDEVLARVQTNVARAFKNVDTPSALAVKTVTGQYTVSTADDVVLADPTRAAFALVLPDPKTFTGATALRKIGSSANGVTVRPASPSVMINGADSIDLTAPVFVVADGSNYWTI